MEVCIIDDELYCLEFLFDFLEAKSINYEKFENCKDAFDFFNTQENLKNAFNAYIIDLNIPINDSILTGSIDGHAEKEIYTQFPGLFLAQTLRNKGVLGKNIILYSVHQRDDISNLARDRLDVHFISKGKAGILKDMIRTLCNIT